MQATDTLASARGRPLRVAALDLLAAIAASHESARVAMRDVLETAQLLVSKAWPLRQRHHAATSSSVVSIQDELAVQEPADEESEENLFEFDCFLSHCWGKDELERDNHGRVAHVCKLLQDSGVRPWFDVEQMRGAINSRMSEGIANSSAILCFITQNYIIKASGLGPRGEDDNCYFEFDSALLERGRSRLLPIVMEPRCLQTGCCRASPSPRLMSTYLPT